MKKIMVICALSALMSTTGWAETLPFNLNISGAGIDVSKNLVLSDVGEGKTKIQFDLADKKGVKYSFDLNYKNLASNRSYPTNLDILDSHTKCIIVNG